MYLIRIRTQIQDCLLRLFLTFSHSLLFFCLVFPLFPGYSLPSALYFPTLPVKTALSVFSAAFLELAAVFTAFLYRSAAASPGFTTAFSWLSAALLRFCDFFPHAVPKCSDLFTHVNKRSDRYCSDQAFPFHPDKLPPPALQSLPQGTYGGCQAFLS